MNIKYDRVLNTFNIFATLILGVASLLISINSFRLSNRQTIIIERQNLLEEGQLKLELKNASLELINVSSMLLQTVKDYPNIQKSLNAFNEMKRILEGQLKNKLLIENQNFAENWTELLGEVNFNIKLFQTGISTNVKIEGAYKTIQELEAKCSELFMLFNK